MSMLATKLIQNIYFSTIKFIDSGLLGSLSSWTSWDLSQIQPPCRCLSCIIWNPPKFEPSRSDQRPALCPTLE